MVKVAKAPPGTTIRYGEHVFEFADGTRNVSGPEIAVLDRYAQDGGPVKVEISEPSSKKKEE